MAHKEADLDKIKKLIEIMKNNDLVEVEIAHGDDKILLKRSQPGQPTITAMPMSGQAVSALSPTSSAESFLPGSGKNDGLVDIKSPIVGTFYATASPDSDPFVEINSKITSQTVVCIIEAMKVMNEIKAEISGTVVEILATSGQAVEYGQVLFKVKPD